MDPLAFFGIGTALVGFGGIGVTFNAYLEILGIPKGPGTMSACTVLVAMVFIMAVNIGIVVAGLWVAIAVAGGVHG